MLCGCNLIIVETPLEVSKKYSECIITIYSSAKISLVGGGVEGASCKQKRKKKIR